MKTPRPIQDGECPYCLFGLPPKVKDLYARNGVDPQSDEYAYGPGHVVFADENYDDNSIRACLDYCAEYLRTPSERRAEWVERAERVALAVPILEALLEIPEAERVWE